MVSEASIPADFRDRLTDILSAEDIRDFLNHVEGPRSLSLRMAREDVDPAGIANELQAEGFETETVSWIDEALVLTPPDRTRLHRSAVSRRGDVFVQSLSSMAAVEALEVQQGLDVLDCCAAPGGKTSLIRMRQRGEGILVANDLSRARTRKLQSVLNQFGLEGVEIITRPAESLGGTHESCFDRVLLDAPCSGEGRFRSDQPSTWSDWEIGKIRRLSRLQQRLLRSGIRTLRPGGILVYATCTLAPEENEVVVARVLESSRIPIEIEPIRMDCPQRRPGLGAWEGDQLPKSLAHSVRLQPGDGMTPFFMTRIRRLA